MSDNLWLADKRRGEVRWLSLDGAKMEASHTVVDVDSFLDYMKQQYDWDPQMWSFYELSVRNMMVSCQGLLGSKTYYVE